MQRRTAPYRGREVGDTGFQHVHEALVTTLRQPSSKILVVIQHQGRVQRDLPVNGAILWQVPAVDCLCGEALRRRRRTAVFQIVGDAACSRRTDLRAVVRRRRTRSCRQGAWTSRDLANSWSKDGSQGSDHVGLSRARGKCWQCKVQGFRRGPRKACSSCQSQRQGGEGSRARAHLTGWRGRCARTHPWASRPGSPCRWPPGENGGAVRASRASIEVGGRPISGCLSLDSLHL